MPLRKHPFPLSLSRRYDGPVPQRAALEADHDAPHFIQYHHRRLMAWQEVRSLGKALAFENRAFRETANISHYHEWKRLRKHLAFAVRSWRTYRDWEKAAEPNTVFGDPAGNRPCDVEPVDDAPILTDQ